MKYTDILIDLDDTLIDTAANTKATVQEVYKDYHLGEYFESFDDFFAFYHKNVSKLWDMYNKGQVSKEELQTTRFTTSLSHLDGFTDAKIKTINEDYIERVMQKDTLVEGAIELLDYLKSKYKMHILSNGFTEMQYKKMRSAKISENYFDNIILSDAVGINKPHPDIFRFALKQASCPAEKTIMIGDNLQTDIIGARNSGIDQLWFNPESKATETIQPTFTVRRLNEIKDIL